MDSYLGFLIVVISSFHICCGQPCGEDINSGVCKILSECPSGIKQVIQGKTHHLKRCGFQGSEEIVCCPDFKNESQEQSNNTKAVVWDASVPTNARGSFVDRKSLAACKEYLSSSTTFIGDYIISGEDAALGEFPHMAQIGFPAAEFPNKYTWECGGSLISSRFVLTAAHCVYKVNGILPSIVRLGFVDSDFLNYTIAQKRAVKNVTVHPEYSRRSKQNDIALIELVSEIKINSFSYPACLHQINENPSNLLITGWGNTVARGTAPSRILQKAQIEPIQLSKCSTLFKARSTIRITSSHICCLSPKNSSVDTCQGDSGGPLQKLISSGSTVYSIVGVTSYGQGCGGVTPGVYTRVSSYLDWIEQIVWT